MPKTTIPPRVEFLDQYRGFTIVVMILVNTLSGFTVVPAGLKHATSVGSITLTDFVITSFMFIIGVAYELAFPKSLVRHGRAKTIRRYIRRSLLLIFFGLLGSVLLKRDLLGEWGVLQTIGTAGLVALPFMFVCPSRRPAVAVGLIALYELTALTSHWVWLTAHDTGRLGGVPGGLAWAGVVLLGSWAGSYIRQGNVRGLRLACITLAISGVGLGLLLCPWLPIYKPLVTTTYLLVTTGCAGALLLAFSLLDLRFLPFKLLGVNALAMFMLHGLLDELAMLVFPKTSPMPVVLLVVAGVYALCFTVAGLFYWKRILIRL